MKKKSMGVEHISYAKSILNLGQIFMLLDNDKRALNSVIIYINSI